MLYLILCFLLGFFNSSLLSLSLSLPPTHLCRPEHSSALLKFKRSLSLAYSICLQELQIPSFHETKSSDEGTDCCKWKGVVCDNKKGNVIGLDLSCSGLIGSLQSDSSLFSLQNLRWLNLAGNDFGNTEIPSEFGKLRSLTYLNLSLTGFTGFVPPDISLFVRTIFHLLYLQNISLRRSPNLIGYLPETNWNSSLSLLDVSETRFSKGLPGSIGNLKHLKTLSRFHYVFTGFIPSALGNLTKLTFLDISGNMFQGQIPDVFGNLNDLSSMDFSFINFNGVFPLSAFNLTNLTYMKFFGNFLHDTLPNNISGLSVPGLFFCLPSLEHLDLSSNKLYGIIPSSFFDLINLTFLNLSSNNLSGNIKLCMLMKLRNLEFLDLSFNNLLSLTRCSNDVNSTLPMINQFHFSSGNMQHFPSFLNASKHLQVLDISNNQIHSSITKWEAEGLEGLGTLKLSMNFITSIEQIPGNYLSVLDLRYNSHQGSLPTPPQALGYFLISNNGLVGEILSKICNLSFLYVLDLSMNKLGRTIPDCFGTFNDQLSMVVLRTVKLNGKQLEGSIPLFHGDIQNFNGTFSFRSLRVIDLSQNDFIGHILPELFENSKSMKDIQVEKSDPVYMGGDYYQDSLISLIVLNFSHNSLAGNILPSLGKMLQGKIPMQLTDLTFLGALNLSHNNLEEQIPLANHFDTFSNDSFNGNSRLCGFPLSKKCGNNQEPESPPSIVADEFETTLVWKIAAMGYGSGLVLGLSMGYIVFTTGRPRWLVKMIKRNPQKRRRINQNGRRKN
ncbi:hypothetical protein ES332_A04G055900v1 [Gossypium tomentosum]|uniref:Uncharacterized protein n=1 Tax=Gossypium tomentosum TaxID=34277 RepID=A0A5D2QW67_GOSTO|nr:hypothetical protein ES332_A04G055900v1 [Gossypium tomentosum]